MPALTETIGFASPIAEKTLSRRRTLKIELIATLALAVALIVAATAVSIGVARAQGLGAAGDRRDAHARSHCCLTQCWPGWAA